jgi:heme-binding NEAT domain protein
MKTKVNLTDLEVLKIYKLGKIKKNDLDSTVKKLKTGLIEEILKSHTTLLQRFLENPK